MTNFIPIFPLEIVVYPGEQLHLHIFEPRYKQLISDCYTANKPFGIPTVLQNGIAEMGTLVAITEVSKVYDDGKMDIKTKGLQPFAILEVVKELPDKLYHGAIVNYPANAIQPRENIFQKLYEQVKKLHLLINVTKDFKKPMHELLSYDIAHHIGLSLTEEYAVLQLLREEQRLEYLKRHIEKVIAVITGMEDLKERIQLNGHFKELKGFNL
ncbi:MAG: LON peptidase substrate-binding domain-containing protein [Chitinophagaceae bacterium]|nr:LON peptidase substrate-binding domain-containing protein [Chitinophagaceae bacterium]